MYRILVVEDDPIMQRTIRDTLKAEGLEIVISGDGESGLKAASADKPDLILLDMNLPDTDGLSICAKLKSDPKLRHIPVVILTGEARDIAQRVRGLDAGAEDYLFKPFSPRVLSARILSILRMTSGPTRR